MRAAAPKVSIRMLTKRSHEGAATLARITVQPDGENVREIVELGTHVPAENDPTSVFGSPAATETETASYALAISSHVLGDPSENRTRVTGVRGRCPNR
jgi:hypothetical protein